MTDHQWTQKYLPWYINGTLVGEEYAHVHRHLKQCVLCQQELAELSAYSQEIAAEGVQINNPASALAELQPHLTHRTRSAIWSKLNHIVNHTPLAIRVLVIAQLLAVTLLSGYLVLPNINNKAVTGYTTLSSPSHSIGDIRLVFSTQSTPEDQLELLQVHGLELVEPVSTRGIATVRWRQRRQQEEEFLDSLRALPDIVLAEPINSTSN